MNRQAIIEKIRGNREEIRLHFNSVAYWNENVRKPDEPEIDPDPDGTMKDIDRAYTELLDREDAKHLWCVHVIGPDELRACESRAAAEKATEELREWAEKQDFADVVFTPEVAVWPHDAASHAADLVRWNPELRLDSENARGMARELAAQDSESPTRDNG